MSGRVLHVIPSVAVAHGGPSRAIRLMEQALARTDWRGETATTDDDGRGHHLARALRQRVMDGQAARWYFCKSTEFYKVAWSFVPWIVREVRRYDVVHIHALFSFTSVVAAWAARQAGVPYVIRPLGVLNRYGLTQRRPLFKRLSLRFVEGPLLRDAAAIHFTSEAERDEALALGIPLRPVIIPLGVEIVEVCSEARLLAHLPTVGEQPRLLYMSRLDPMKNVENLLRALGTLRRDGLRPTLLVAGDGDGTYVQHLKALARKEGIEDQVHWLGHVSGEAKADVLAAADVFVLPSFSESFGIAVVEALAAGLPCVVGRGVALAQAVEQSAAGVSVNPDAESIAAGIRCYLESAELRSKAGAAARQLARREYSVDMMGDRLVALYASIRRKT